MKQKNKACINIIFKPLIPALIAELTNGLETISKALENGDTETIERLSHGFKGATGNYQLHDLSGLFLNLENDFKHGNFGMIPERIRIISDYLSGIEIEYTDDY